VVQGLATGAALGAVGAGLLDLDRVKGTVANAVAPMSGTAIGGLLAGFFVQYLPAPSQLIYIVLSVVFVAQAIGVVLMPETTSPRPGAVASLRPDLALPPAARRPMLAAAPVLVAAWALAGLYLSLGPALARQTVHSGSILIGGLVVFIMAGSAALTVLLTRNISARRMMAGGIATVLVGVGISVIAISTASGATFFASLVIAGAGFGPALQGAIRTVLPAANEHERAGLLSLVYVLSYLSLGLPAVIAGTLVVYGGGLRATAVQYSLAVIALAAVALATLRRPSPARG
jgi:MFS family permease